MTDGNMANMGNSNEGCCGKGQRQQRHHGEEGKSCCGGEASAGAAAGEQAHQGHHGHHGGGQGGCCGHGAGHGHGPMHIPTAEERIARLEAYLQDLRAEASMVEARISQLKSA